MLSGESAIGSFGQKALAVLDMTSSRMESWSREENRQSLLNHHKLGASLPECITEQICNCAVEMGTSSHYFLQPAIMLMHVLFIFERVKSDSEDLKVILNIVQPTFTGNI